MSVGVRVGWCWILSFNHAVSGRRLTYSSVSGGMEVWSGVESGVSGVTGLSGVTGVSNVSELSRNAVVSGVTEVVSGDGGEVCGEGVVLELIPLNLDLRFRMVTGLRVVVVVVEVAWSRGLGTNRDRDRKREDREEGRVGREEESVGLGVASSLE